MGRCNPPLRKNCKARHRISFWSVLTPEGKEAYKAYSEANIELMSISEADIFTKGFRLGVQLLLAAICEDDSQLPPLEEP